MCIWPFVNCEQYRMTSKNLVPKIYTLIPPHQNNILKAKLLCWITRSAHASPCDGCFKLSCRWFRGPRLSYTPSSVGTTCWERIYRSARKWNPPWQCSLRSLACSPLLSMLRCNLSAMSRSCAWTRWMMRYVNRLIPSKTGWEMLWFCSRWQLVISGRRLRLWGVFISADEEQVRGNENALKL